MCQPLLRLSSLVTLCVVCALAGPATGAAQDGVPSLAAALRARPADHLQEIALMGDQFVRGFGAYVHQDTVYLRQELDSGRLYALPLHEVLLVREWHANAGRGAGWGATSGAVIVGGFGALLGLVLASLDGDSGDEVGPVIGLTLLGAGAGAVGGALVGGGVGALVQSWHRVWPDPEVPLPIDLPQESRNTRFGLFAGAGRSQLESYEVTRLAGRISLHKTLGPHATFGPEIGYYDFGGHTVDHQPGYVAVESHSGILQFSAGSVFRARGRKLMPYAALGVGWYLSNDTFLGVHLGGGLAWRIGEKNDLGLDVRYHFSITDVDSDQVDRFWTLGLALGFGL